MKISHLCFCKLKSNIGINIAEDESNNEIYIGDYQCKIISTVVNEPDFSDTTDVMALSESQDNADNNNEFNQFGQTGGRAEIICRIDSNSSLIANKNYPIELLVKNKGYVLQTEYNLLKFKPAILTISPNRGSENGGTQVTILGDGFDPTTTQIYFGTNNYFNRLNAKINYTLIEFNTTSDQVGIFQVHVLVNGIEAVCIDQCNFTIATSETPVVNSIAPNEIRGPNTEVVINGQNFGTNISGLIVRIGSNLCNVSEVNDTRISCILNGLSLGFQPIQITTRFGSSYPINNLIRGIFSVLSMFPDIGSIFGGSLVTITGNGFVSNSTIRLNTSNCTIVSLSVTQIKCLTTPNTITKSMLRIT